MRSFLLGMLLAAPAGLVAADAVPPFSNSAPLVLEGKGAVYALTLPEAAYRGFARRDLGDVRVLNGAGEVVPYALERLAATEVRAGSTLSPGFFPLLGPRGRPVEEASLRVERLPDGTVTAVVTPGERRTPERRVLGYLVDVSATKGALREIAFQWPAGPDGSALDARVEASDDLRSWRTVASGPLMVLRRGDMTLERRAIELPSVRAKYLRLSWRPGQEDPKLTGVELRLSDEATDAARAWMRFEAVAGTKPGEYVFELPAGLPVDRMRFELPQENAVVSAAVSVQEKAAGPERVVASGVLYRMEHVGQKLSNPDFLIAATAEKRWILRVDQRGGGLGAGLPVLLAGWVPHRLVFVARGEPPFRLLFGNAEAGPAAMPVRSLMPGGDDTKPVEALAAKLGTVSAQAMPEKLQPSVGSWFAQADRKKLWLWGALMSAVLVIVGMAWRLTREMPIPGEPRRPRPPGEVR